VVRAFTMLQSGQSSRNIAIELASSTDRSPVRDVRNVSTDRCPGATGRGRSACPSEVHTARPSGYRWASRSPRKPYGQNDRTSCTHMHGGEQQGSTELRSPRSGCCRSRSAHRVP